MRHHYFCFACLAGAISLLPALASAANDGADKWQPLFNGRDLTGWYTFITGHGRDKDPNGLIQVHDGMIHAYKDADNGTDQPIGYLCANKEYSHYRLRFQYKWGKKRFAPRAETLRDAGLLYHATGPDGRWGGVWPLSVECQVQETDTGDLITVDTRCTAYIDPSTKRKENEYPVYVPVEEGGEAIKNTWYISADKVRDRLEGWNDVEVEVRGAKRAVHIVNGKVNQRLADIEQPTDDGWAPLEKGRIAFQIESAEVLYRNIEILPLAPDRPSAEESEHDQPASPPPDAQSTTRGVDGLTVPDGFQIEVVAAPPLIRHPMMACLDDRGRLFVAESDGTNRESVAEILTDRPHQILMLEDTDADGRFDKSTVFAEGLIQANGAEWHDGALYVCSAPYVWRFRDLDGDGRADEQVRVAGKFNFDGMSSAFHGPAFGPDGRLYWSGGQHGWKLEQTLTKPDARAASGAGGPDADLDVPWTRTAPGAFASWPDGSDAESIGYGGIANPVEVAFTEEGEVLGTIALFDYLDSQRRDAVVHWIKGGVYNLKEHNYPGLIRTGEDLIPLSYRGHAAPSGITRYRGDSFGQDFRDNFFFTEFNTRKVYRLIVARDGATFRSRDEVFLASSNPDSHFTDVMEDPGGSLLIVDTGGWFLHGCPTSQIAKPNIYGAIYRIRRDDGRRVDDPRGQRLRWEEASNTELVSRFEDSRYAVRDRAIHELAKRQAVPVLGEALANGSPRERLLAVWSLNRICTPEARKAVRTALSDGDNSVRLAAIHSVRLWRDKASAPRLIESLSSDSLAVRRQAATALGSLKAVAAAPALLRAAELGGDRFLEHAITFALIEISDDAPIAEGLKSDSPTTCRLALIALDQRDSPLLTREIVTALLDSPDKLLQKAALDVVRKHPQWSGEILGRLATWLNEPEPTRERQASIRGTIRSFWKDEAVQQLVADQLVADETSEKRQLLLLDAIAAIDSDELPLAWLRGLETSLKRTSPEIVSHAIATLAKRGLPEFQPTFRELALSDQHPDSVRIAAAACVARHQQQISSDIFDLLLTMCAADRDTIDRLASAQAIASAQLSIEQLQRLAKFLPEAGPLEISALLRPFEHCTDSAIGLQLVDALGVAKNLSGVSSQQLTRLLAGYSEEVIEQSKTLLSQLDANPIEQAVRLEKLCDELSGGDPVAGRTLFFGTRAACSTCHRIGAEGGQVGPNLSRVAEIRTRRDLVEAVVFPSASFAREYEPYVAITTAGKVFDGIISRQTPQALYLRSADLTEVRLDRDDIDDLQPSQVSIMPQGLDKVLSPDELRDIISFLLTLK